MSDLFESGHVVYWILALMFGEFVVLFALHRAAVISLTVLEAAASLGAGAALLLALRGALLGAGWHVVALWLLAALAAHGVDVAARLRGDARRRAAHVDSSDAGGKIHAS